MSPRAVAATIWPKSVPYAACVTWTSVAAAPGDDCATADTLSPRLGVADIRDRASRLSTSTGFAFTANLLRLGRGTGTCRRAPSDRLDLHPAGGRAGPTVRRTG